MTTPDLTYTVTLSGTEYTVDVFTTLGAFTWIPPTGVTLYGVLLVAGGASGAKTNNGGGGGGAGGLLWLTSQSCTPGVGISGSVGAGGAARTGDVSSTNLQGNDGSDSTFGSDTAIGGGGGAHPSLSGRTGGSGGGGTGTNVSSPGGAGTTGQGSNGGAGYASATASDRAGGGGGGKGSSGSAATSSTGGNGGTGYDASSLLGTTIGAAGRFASGGGGGGGSTRGGASPGGGGRGGSANVVALAESGSAGTGGGGGGGGGNGGGGTDAGDSGAGGSGIVAIRYILPIAPGAPTDLAVTDITTTTATATWGAPTTGGTPTGYKVTLDPGTETDAGNVLTYDLTGLTAGTTYTVTVTPYNAAGDGTPDSVDFTTDLPAPPGIPTNVTATPGSTTITLTWDDPATGDPATSYDVRIDGGSATDAGDVNTYEFDSLDMGTDYTVSVRAVNAAGESAWVDKAVTTTTTPYMPDVEVSIAFDSGYTTADADRTWTDVTDYVEASSTLSIARGRPDEFSTAQPSRLTVTLDNRDGRFTPEYASGAYYPDVKKGRPIRVRVRWPADTGTWYTRFVGYVDEWPVEWPDGTESMSTVTVTASSRGARMGHAAELRSIPSEEILPDDPVLYYPLEEASGATSAGNIAPGRTEVLTISQVGTGGTLEFGSAVDGTDGLTAAKFTPVDDDNGKYLTTTLVDPAPSSGDAYLDIECEFVTSSAGVLVALDIPGTPAYATLLLVAGQASISTVDQDRNGASTTIAFTPDGEPHYLSGRLAYSAGTIQTSLVLDDGDRVSEGDYSATGLQGFTRLSVGNNPADDDNLFVGSVSQVAVFAGSTALADSRIAAHYGATTGFTDDSSGERIERYARYAGIPDVEVSAETGLTTSIASKNTTGQTPLALMEAVAETEDGLVFDGKDGTLTFHARDHRYNVASSFTLDVDAGDVEVGLTPRLGDQHMSNDIKVTRPGGAEGRAVNQDSVDEYGPYADTLEVLTTSDNEAQSRADWQVNRFGTPRVTIPDLSVDLLSCGESLITSLLAADLGTRLTVDNLPAQAPAESMDFFIEGISEDIGFNSYRMSFNTSRTEYAIVWQLDSETNSQLGTTTVLAY